MSTFPRNQWYVAAYGGESHATNSSPAPSATSRSSSTAPGRTAPPLSDRCVHRRFPLSQSRLDGDRVVCGYHGFTYGADGGCVSVPGQRGSRAPPGVTSYPVRGAGLVHLGLDRRPHARRQRPIPRAPWLDPDSGYDHGRRHGADRSRYSLLVDNLLDLSHETYLHGGYIGTPEVAETPIDDRGRREKPGSSRQPADGRRRVPAVLRQLHRHHRPDLPLAGRRVPRPLPLPAAQPDRAGRLAAERGRHRPRRLPHRDHLRDHARDRQLGARLLDGLARLRPRRRGGDRVPRPRTTTPW